MLHFNPPQIDGKRLKVQHKQLRADQHSYYGHEAPWTSSGPSPQGSLPLQQYAQRPSSQPTQGSLPMQQYAQRPSSQPRQHRGHRGRSPAGFVPVQEYAGPPEYRRRKSSSQSEEAIRESGEETAQRSATSPPSPLSDLKDIGKSLPDFPPK